MRIVFAGTPDFAAIHLQALLDVQNEPSQPDNLNIVGVYTQPDRPAGRGRKLTPSAVKQLAIQHELPVYQPETLKTAEAKQALSALQPDIMVVVAYGLILPQAILDIPALGCLNVHASLLPRWRGAAPIQRAIQAGDAETGVTIMQMDAGLDTGDMLATAALPIQTDTTSARLHDDLAALGGPCLVGVLQDLSNRQAAAEPQNDQQATYAHKLSKDEAWLDWQRPANELLRQIHAFNPWPVAQTRLNDKRLRIFSGALLSTSALPPGVMNQHGHVGSGAGDIQLHEVQIEGGKRLAMTDFLRGHELDGQTLQSPHAC